jgi:hypothetical protein
VWIVSQQALAGENQADYAANENAERRRHKNTLSCGNHSLPGAVRVPEGQLMRIKIKIRQPGR